MGDLSENFDTTEFTCKCGCGFDTISHKLVNRLQDLREAWGFPILVKSGCRCFKHNHSVGGSRNSYHLNGMGSDITPVSITEVAEVTGWDKSIVMSKFNEFCWKEFDGNGIIFYPIKRIVHVDVRGYRYQPFPDLTG